MRRARIITRFAGFFLAACLLAYVCRQGSSLLTVAVVFVAYVAAATVWVRGQYEAAMEAERLNDPDRKPWTPTYWVSGLVVLGSASLAVFGWVADSGHLLVVGILFGAFAVGYFVMRVRVVGVTPRRPQGLKGLVVSGDERNPTWQEAWASQRWVIAGAFAITAIGVLLGLWRLEEQPTWGVALAIGVLVAPVWLSVAAEPAIGWLQQGQRTRQRRWSPVVAMVLGVIGLMLACVAAARLANEQVPWLWLAAAFLALALLVVAVVSSSQADTAAVIAAVCLMGVTPMSEARPSELTGDEAASADRLLVVLGDSYMSGEGADIYYQEDADGDGREDGGANRCHRAPTAWAALAGQTDRLFDGAVLLACSGANTVNVRHDSDDDGNDREFAQFNEPGTQLDQVEVLEVEPGEEDLVVLSLGGNDAGFSTIGAVCLAPGDCNEQQQRRRWMGSLPQVSRALTATYEEIRGQFPNAPILVTAYPDPLYSEDGDYGADCEGVALSEGDRKFIGDFVRALNITVGTAALAEDFYFLAESERALANAHLQLCDPENDGRPGLNFIGLRSVGGVAEHRFNPKNWYHNSLHPNARGHAAILQVFESWRADHPVDLDMVNPEAAAEAAALEEAAGEFDLGAANEAAKAARTGGTTTGDDNGSGDEVLVEQCDLFLGDADTDAAAGPGCRDGGAQWARGQVVDLLWGWWGLLIALTVACGWLFGVGLYGWRRPWWGPPDIRQLPTGPRDTGSTDVGQVDGAESAPAPGHRV